MTINEYLYKNNLTITDLADLLDVSESTVKGYLEGNPASPANSSKMAKLGIIHPSRVREKSRVATSVREVKKKVETFNSEILKEYQVVTVRQYGNTIVSKKHKAEEIIDEFAKFGLKVELKDFQDKNYHGWNTHYVVTNVGGVKR